MNDDASEVVLGSFEGETLTGHEIEFIKEEQPVGVTLFGRNIATNYQVIKDFLSDYQALNHSGKHPFLVAIDQEGGRVRRIKDPFPNEGPAYTLKDGKSEPQAKNFIFNYGSRVGEELSDLGININFAPVVDCFTNPDNHAIGDRCFSSSPEEVETYAGAFLYGMQKRGVLGCLKHFPGQGHANFDTHEKSASIDLSLDDLKNRELIPFQNLINDAPMVMIAHCFYPHLDSCEATLSSKIMNLLLRKKMGFQGVVVTDDMTMGAMVKKDTDWNELIIQSILNGSDLVLVCKGLDMWRHAIQSIRSEAKSSQVFRSRLSDAAMRVRELRAKIASYQN